MFQKLIATDDRWVGFVLRLTLAIVIFPHGAQKMLGWFGGYGPSATVGWFASIGVPALLAWLVIIAEFFGSLGLFFGFLGRVAAAGIACVMLGAMYLVHIPNGFFMNWSGQQAGEGFEYHLLVLGIVIALWITGSGRFSVDRALSRSA